MNEKGANSVLSSKVKLGADASAAAMKAEVLSWSRARGVLVAYRFSGSTLRSDDDANKNLYGQKLNAKEIVREGQVKTPPDGKDLIDLLQKTSPRHTTSG